MTTHDTPPAPEEPGDATCGARHPTRFGVRCLMEPSHHGEDHATTGHGAVGSDEQWDTWPCTVWNGSDTETPPAPTSAVLDDYDTLCVRQRRETRMVMRLPPKTSPLTRVEQQVNEVLARGTGWKLRGQWPMLEVHSPDYHGGPVGAYVLVYIPCNDTWGRTYLKAGDSVDLSPEALSRRSWRFWYLSAEDAAVEVEQLVAHASTVPGVRP